MANPILPLWEYIPDGEPRVFGDRVYLYGSHDRVGSHLFCDYKLKVWSAPLNDLNNWTCHGDMLHTRPLEKSDIPWTDHEFYAPDVIEKDGKYYAYCYIVGAKGAVCVADRPEGPFKLLSNYRYAETTKVGDDGIFNDAGVLVDDDGKVYVYYGFTESNMNELDPETMCDVIPASYMRPVIDDRNEVPEEQRFFEASSPRKVGNTYYLIYSPRRGSRLAYATSDSPRGPFTYRGYIVDNGVEFPGGNNHGSIANINGQWYVFYHRMTNNSVFSRRACVEKINILPDGTIPPVEMTSLGFEESLNPYVPVPAEIACVLVNGPYVIEKDIFTRLLTNVKKNSVIGYKYFDFGDDFHPEGLKLALKTKGAGVRESKVHVYIDDYPKAGAEFKGREIGTVTVGLEDGAYKGDMEIVTGRHALFFVTDHESDGWPGSFFEDRPLFMLESFAFLK